MRDTDAEEENTERTPVDQGPQSVETTGRPEHSWSRHRTVWAVVAACFVLLLGAAVLIPLRRAGDGAQPAGTAVSPSTELTVPTAPGTTVGPKAIVSVRSFDLANATYPSTACPVEYRLPGDSFTLVNGMAGSLPDQMGAPRPDLMRGVDLQGVTYGDVTGDGIEEAMVRLRCYIPNSDGLSTGVVVMGVNGDQLVTVAVLPDSMVPAVGTKVVVDDDRTPVRLEQRALELEGAAEVRVVNGQLVVRWQQVAFGGDAFGSGYDVTVIYRIDGHGATVVGQPARTVIVSEPNRERLAAYAIRTADLRSLTLPLAAEGRSASDRVCPAVFDPVGPVRDATLHDGAAAVVTADGRAIDASVRIEDVRYAFTDPDPYEDALVTVQCTAGDQGGQATVVVRWVDGAPVIAEVLG
jgi:hypothetical protein